MSADIKKRGLGRGLDALFRDAKVEQASINRPVTTRIEEETPAPKLKRADELIAASQQAAAAPESGAKNIVADAAVLNKNTAQRKLPIDKLTPGKYQPRHHFNDEAIDQLAESISVHGIIQPLIVRPIAGGMFEIIAGERRWRAAQKAKVHDVPVVIREMTDSEALEFGLIENLQREDLTALEEAEGYQRLIDEFSHTQEVLAHHLGKSRSHIANTLRLLKLPSRVKGLITTGALSAGHARALVTAPNAEEVANIVVKRSLSVRQTEKLIQGLLSGGKKAPSSKKPTFVKKDVDTLALEEKMVSLLGLKVTIDASGSAGKITIEYKTLDQLDDVLARLSSAPR